MKKNITLLLGGLLFGLIIGWIIIASSMDGLGIKKQPGPPVVGRELSDFTLVSVDGKPISLKELRGKPVVINFWATWCPPCRDEMPLLQAVASQYQSEISFVAVNNAEPQGEVQSFVDEMGISFPVALDSDGAVCDLFYVSNFPTTFFVDEEGILRAQHIGMLDEGLMSQYLAAIGVTP